MDAGFVRTSVVHLRRLRGCFGAPNWMGLVNPPFVAAGGVASPPIRKVWTGSSALGVEGAGRSAATNGDGGGDL